MMATLDVLQRAAAKGANLVITHEPTFYNHLDRPEGMDENDAVWKEKREFIEKNGLVVWRFHDHWHLRTPDGILAGVVKSLGWEKYSERGKSAFVHGAGNHAGEVSGGRGEAAGYAGAARSGKSGDEGNEAGAESGIGRIRTGDACAGNGKRRGVAGGGNTRMGNGGVRGRRGGRGKEKSAHRDRTCAIRAGGNGRVRALAENICEKRAGGIRADETAVLDTGTENVTPMNKLHP